MKERQWHNKDYKKHGNTCKIKVDMLVKARVKQLLSKVQLHIKKMCSWIVVGLLPFNADLFNMKTRDVLPSPGYVLSAIIQNLGIV